MPREVFNGKLIRIYCTESDQLKGAPLYEAILYKCKESGIAEASVYRGLEGFGLSAEIHKHHIWPFANYAPVMVSIIDRDEAVDRFLPQLDSMIGEGLIATSSVQIIRYTPGNMTV